MYGWGETCGEEHSIPSEKNLAQTEIELREIVDNSEPMEFDS